ncbi:MAG: hypothetical protein GX564_11175 [Oligosphaeraceae bacterium]|nr:hypothetical protein [Oligosphaeraceae bacterium]
MIHDSCAKMFCRPLAFLILAAFCCCALAQEAAPNVEVDEVDEEEVDTAAPVADWRAERDEILKQIKKNVDDYVNKTVTRGKTTQFIVMSINRGLNQPDRGGNFRNLRGVNMKEWQWDDTDKGVSIPEPQKSLSDIIEQRSADIENRVRKRYPESKRAQFEIDAREKYKMFEKNTTVSFVLRGGVGTNTRVEGIFHNLTSERVQVGKRFITRKDLDEDTEAKFYRDKNAIRIKTYIENMNNQYDATIANTIEELKHRELPPEFHTSGYVPDPAMEGSNIKTAKPEYWVPRRELHTRIYNLLRDLARKTFTPIETKRLFTEKGFIEGENEEGKIEWMPQAEYDRIQALKQATQAQPGAEGAPNPDGMPPDEPPPPM